MALNNDQLNDLRIDLGDMAQAFSDAELQRFAVRTTSAPDGETQLRAIKALCIEGLLNSAAKMHDYVAGATAHKLSQVYKQLQGRYEDYLPALEVTLGGKPQFARATLRAIPHPDRALPGNGGDSPFKPAPGTPGAT